MMQYKILWDWAQSIDFYGTGHMLLWTRGPGRGEGDFSNGGEKKKKKKKAKFAQPIGI